MNTDHTRVEPLHLIGVDPADNLLPYDGTVHYHGPVLGPGAADRYFGSLLATIPWTNDRMVIFGRHIVTARKVGWFGDEAFSYTYSGTTKQALPWTDELRALKVFVEQLTGDTFNSCLLNLYHDGSAGMAWHSDDEASLARHAAIASLSLGAERRFLLRHKRTRQTISLSLESGSLLVMKDTTQSHWLHCLPKSKRISSARINLTFRTIVPS